MLERGGVLILQFQPWKSYKRLVDHHGGDNKTEDVANLKSILNSIEFHPGQFIKYLTESLEFEMSNKILLKRPVYILRKSK